MDGVLIPNGWDGGVGTDYEWMRLNNCKVGFKHGNGDSKDTEFKRYPEDDVKDSTSVQKLHETVNETTTSMRAFKKGEGVDASTIYLTDASVSTTTCGEGKSVSATSLFDSKVWRKVGDKFYPWWVKLTYYKVTNSNGWQKDVINASEVTNKSDEVLSIHSNEEYKLKTTTDNLEGYTFNGWVVDSKDNTTNVTPTKDINAYAKYNVQKFTMPSQDNVTIKKGDDVVNNKSINYGSTIVITANKVVGKHLTSFKVDDTNIVSDTTPDDASYTISKVMDVPTISTSYELDVYELKIPSTFSNGKMEYSANTVKYDTTVSVTFTPNNNYYLSKVVCGSDIATLTDDNNTLTTSGKQTKTLKANKDRTHGSSITVTPTFIAFVYKLVNGTLTNCSVEVKKDNNKQNSATCGTQYDVVVTPSAGHHFDGEATIDMNQSLTNGTADGDGMKYKWTPTLDYSKTGSNGLTSGSAEVKVSATCVIDVYNVSAEKSSKGSVTFSSDTVQYDKTVTAKFTPNDNYYLKSFTVTNGVGTDAGSTLTASGAVEKTITANKDLVHNSSIIVNPTFDLFKYKLKYENPTGGKITVKKGTTTNIVSDSSIDCGTTYTMTVAPDPDNGYHVTSYTVNGTTTNVTEPIGSPTTTFTPSPKGNYGDDYNISAVCAKNTYTLSLSQPNGGTISVKNGSTAISDGKTLTYGTTYTVTASPTTAKNGSADVDIYKLNTLEWNGTDIKSLKKFSPYGTHNSTITVSATFSKIMQTITINTVNNATITVSASNATTFPYTNNQIQKSGQIDVTVNGLTIGYYISKLGSESFDQNDEASKTLSNYVVWNDITIGGTGKDIPVSVEIKKYTVTLKAKFSDTEIYTYTVSNVEYGTSVSSISGSGVLNNFKKSSNSINIQQYEWDGTWSGTVDNSHKTFIRTIKLRQYTVEYDITTNKGVATGATNPSPQTVNYGTELSMPTAPTTAEGYTFDGWYKSDDTKINSKLTVISDNVVYAKYTAWSFEFKPTENGAEIVPSVSGKNYITLTVAKTDYDELGLSDNATLINVLTDKEYGFTDDDVLRDKTSNWNAGTDNQVTIAFYINVDSVSKLTTSSIINGHVYTKVW